MTDHLSRTALYDWHVAHGGRMVDFAGWSMPVQYTSIIDEHTATRQAATLFDVSHMGRFRFEGPRAAAFLDTLLTRRVSDLTAGKVRYSLICNEAGGIHDDVLVYCLRETADHLFYLLVVNAGNREKIADVLAIAAGDADFTDYREQTLDTAMIAVQGPRALAVVQTIVPIDLQAMKYYTAAVTTIAPAVRTKATDSVECLVSRTGYTGEDGCEFIVPVVQALRVWEELLAAGAEVGIKPAGLGARDSLRLEAAMPLYGHEITEEIDPYRAGLGFAVNLEARSFRGKEALAALSQKRDAPMRVGLEIEGRRPAREGYSILAESDSQTAIGAVTSGGWSPTLDRPIAMGYVPRVLGSLNLGALGQDLLVDIRGSLTPAKVVGLPFYKRK
jgi:aminomethyltransferase